MAVNVNEEVDLPALKSLSYHLLHSENLGGLGLVRLHPLPVQIETSQRAAVVSSYHAVRVKHGHNFEYIGIAECLCLAVIAHYELKEALHDERGIRFAWMDPT